MKTRPIVPARLQIDADGHVSSVDYGDVYHSRTGAFAQARHVFLGGNGLPGRWHGRERFTILETGFGLGRNFLATWQAWRADPSRCTRLHYVAIEAHPVGTADLRRALGLAGEPDAVPHDATQEGGDASLAEALAAAWPPLVPGVHRLAFDDGRVELLLAFFDVRLMLPETLARPDAIYLDGFAPALNPAMWEPRLYKALARLAAPGCTAATWSVAGDVRRGLRAAGFEVRRVPGFTGKREMSTARWAPAFVPRRPPGRGEADPPREVIVVGGGLAGCATAWALAEQGLPSRVLERHDAPAREASGQAAGLFHGIVHAGDGLHARWSRAAALMATPLLRRLIDAHGVAGAVDGLLRLDDGDPAAMAALLDTQALPPSYAQALDRHQASAAAGFALDRPAWFYPGGGWIDPAGLARAYLDAAGASTTWRGGVVVDRLQAVDEGWALLDAAGRELDRAPAVVLANAGDAPRLAAGPGWAVSRWRGQTTGVPAAALATPPHLPVAGDGYLLPPRDGLVWCGATRDADDDESQVRLDDHRRNLAQLARLTGQPLDLDPAMLPGRVGWRLAADDRLPLLGALPDPVACAVDGVRLDQPRLVPRRAGLYACTALGSRGIGWSALAARTVAAWIAGAPIPLEASLLDAVDAARFVSRDARRATARVNP